MTDSDDADDFIAPDDLSGLNTGEFDEPYLMLRWDYSTEGFSSYDEMRPYETAIDNVIARFPTFAHDGTGTGFGRRDHDGTCDAMTGAQIIQLIAELKALNLPDYSWDLVPVFFDDD